MDTFKINVDCRDLKKVIILKVNLNWSIGRVKQLLVETYLAHNEQITQDDIMIIFAGKELLNEVIIRNCDFGFNSIVHAIRVKCKKSLAVSNHESHSNDVVKNGSHSSKFHFHCYCSICKQINPGKLRVRCSKCKDSTFLLFKDPCKWSDVLGSATSLGGMCQNEACDGTVAEFYFKCASLRHQRLISNKTSHDLALPLDRIQYNSKNVKCLSCVETVETILVFPCNKDHILCLNCFRRYCSSKLQERQFILDKKIGYTLSCPLQCPNSLIEELHHFRIMSTDDYEKYKAFAAEEYLISCGGIICPSPFCGTGFMYESLAGLDNIELSIQCPTCDYSFCLKCFQQAHVGSCQVDLNDENSSSSYTNSNDTKVDKQFDESHLNENKLSLMEIQKISKPCPKCKVPTEHNGGCMHIVCTRPGCKFSWCWICQAEWSNECMSQHWF